MIKKKVKRCDKVVDKQENKEHYLIRKNQPRKL